MSSFVTQSRWGHNPLHLLAQTRKGGPNLWDRLAEADPEIVKVAEGLALASMLEDLTPEGVSTRRRQAMREGLYTFAGHDTERRERDEVGSDPPSRPALHGLESFVAGPRNFLIVAQDAETALQVLLLRRRTHGAPRATRARDSRRLGELLGYPPCCIDFFTRFPSEADDLLWLKRSFQATGPSTTKGATRDGFIGDEFIGDGFIGDGFIDPRAIFGLHPVVSHVPCRLDCPATVQGAQRLAEACAQRLGVSTQHLQACLGDALILWGGGELLKVTARGDVLSPYEDNEGPAHLTRAAEELRSLLGAPSAPSRDGGIPHRDEILQDWLQTVPLEIRPTLVVPGASGPKQAARRRGRVAAVALSSSDVSFSPHTFLTQAAARLRWRGHEVVFQELLLPTGRPFSPLLRKVERVAEGADLVVFSRWVPPEMVSAAAPARCLCLANHPPAQPLEGATVVAAADLASVVAFVEGGAEVRALSPHPQAPFTIQSPPFPVSNPFEENRRRRAVVHQLGCHHQPRCGFCADSQNVPQIEGLGDDPAAFSAEALSRIRRRSPETAELLIYSTDFIFWAERFVRAASSALQGIDVLFQARADDLLANWPALKAAASEAAGHGGRLHAYLVGLENFSQAELQRLEKGLDAQTVREVAARLLELERSHPGFVATAYASHGFVLFTPWTRLQELEENLHHARELGLSRLRREYPLTRLRLQPGTRCTRRAKKDGLLQTSPTPWEERRAFERGYAPSLPFRFLHHETHLAWEHLRRHKVVGREDEALAAAIHYARRETTSHHGTKPTSRPKRALLVQPPNELDGARGSLPTGYLGVGLLSLAAHLNAQGVHTEILHLGHENLTGTQRRELLDRALKKPLDLMAVSMNWVHLSLGALQVARHLREAAPAPVPLVVGGQHASLFAREIARDYGDLVDAVITGPAEKVLERLLASDPQKGETLGPGAVLSADPFGDIDALEPYSYRGATPSAAGELAALSTVRGHCPRRCSYCLESWGLRRGGHGALRLHSTDWMVRQVQKFVEEDRRIVTIQDPFFIFGDEPLVELVEALDRAGITLKELNLFVEPGAYGARAWDALAHGPFDLVTVDLGVESGATDLLRAAGRAYSNGAVLAEIEALVSRDLLPYTWWMVGLPGETWAHLEATAQALAATMKAGAVPRWITPLILFPGTSAFEGAPKSGVTPRYAYFDDFMVFSTTPHRPDGRYPELLTHETSGLNYEDILAGTRHLKEVVLQGWDELLARHRASPRWKARLRRLGAMLREPEDEDSKTRGDDPTFSLDTFF